jgi:hypothetical protein
MFKLNNMSEFAKVECLSSVYPIGEGWVGKSSSGEVKFFKSLEDYNTYLQNLASAGRICPDVSVPVAPPIETTVRSLPSGFLEFLPRDQGQQAKYSAMSPSWLGQRETQKALDRGEFAEEKVMAYRKPNK